MLSFSYAIANPAPGKLISIGMFEKTTAGDHIINPGAM